MEKIKQVLMAGWGSKPVWARAVVWFLLGIVVGVTLK